MAKQITFSYDGKDYTLEFTRRTVRQLEGNGFNVDNIVDRPLSVCTELFAGAFLANHRATPKATIEEIFAAMPNKEELIQKLAEMYAEPVNALLAEPEDGEKNVSWAASW